MNYLLKATLFVFAEKYEDFFNRVKEADIERNEILWNNYPGIMSQIILNKTRNELVKKISLKKEEWGLTDEDIETAADKIQEDMRIKYVGSLDKYDPNEILKFIETYFPSENIISKFDKIYNSFKSHYIANNGSKKFDRVYQEINNSNKVKEAFLESARRQISLTGSEYFGLVFLLPYFVFAKNETRAMGALVALKLWDESVNRKYAIANKKEVDDIAEVIMRRFNLQEFL